MLKRIRTTSIVISILFLAACSSADSPPPQPTGAVANDASAPSVDANEAVEPTQTATQPAGTATPLPTSTPQPTTTNIPATPTSQPPSPTLSPTATPQEQYGDSAAGQQELTFELIPHWTLGETRILELTKKRIDYDEGRIQLQGGSRTPVELTVLSLADDGFVLGWTNGKTEIESPLEMGPLVEALNDLSSGATIEYDTDNLGTFSAVRNWQEIAMDMQESLDILVEVLQETGLSESELLQIRDMASQMFSTKEQIEALALEEIQLYHFGFGWGSLELSSPIVYEALIPNPFGGDPFPAVGRLELVDFDQESGQAIIHSAQTLDPDATRQILLGSLQEMAADLGTEPPTESDLPEPFSIENNLQIIVDSNSGWILTTESTQTVVVGPAMREETTTIKDVTP